MVLISIAVAHCVEKLLLVKGTCKFFSVSIHGVNLCLCGVLKGGRPIATQHLYDFWFELKNMFHMSTILAFTHVHTVYANFPVVASYMYIAIVRSH